MAMTAIAAIAAIVVGLLAAKPFLIYVGFGLFLLGYLGAATLTGNGTWIITAIIVIIILIKLTGGKK